MPEPPARSGRTSTQAKPTKDKVATQVTNGGGAMPAFKDSLDPQQIAAVRGLRLVRRRQVAPLYAHLGRSTTTCVTGTS
jgi:hypothetical protein